jgi:hypothetical protein
MMEQLPGSTVGTSWLRGAGRRPAWILVLLTAVCLPGCGGGSQAGKETDPQKIEQRRQEAEKMSQREFQNK